MHLGILQEHGPFYSTPLHSHLSTVHCLNMTSFLHCPQENGEGSSGRTSGTEHFTDTPGQRPPQSPLRRQRQRLTVMYTTLGASVAPPHHDSRTSPCHLPFGTPQNWRVFYEQTPSTATCWPCYMRRENAALQIQWLVQGMRCKQDPVSHLVKSDVIEFLDPRNHVSCRGQEPPFLWAGTSLKTKSS